MLSKHFRRSEFECPCGCGFNTVDSELIHVLELLRAEVGKSITITSGCRCQDYNKYIGSKPDSQHTLGRAADIVVKGQHPKGIYEYLDARFPDQLGLGVYNSFNHIDTRSSKARWDKT